MRLGNNWANLKATSYQAQYLILLIEIAKQGIIPALFYKIEEMKTTEKHLLRSKIMRIGIVIIVSFQIFKNWDKLKDLLL